MPRAAPKTSIRVASRSNPLSTKGNPSGKKEVPNSAKKINGARILDKPVSDQSIGDQSAPNGDDEEFGYLLHVWMVDTYEPSISRVLSVPSSINFAKLHEILQVAFGWASCHMHTFTVMVEPALQGDSDLAHGVALVLEAEVADNVDFDNGVNRQDQTHWTLRDVFEKKEWGGQPLHGVTYEYDMGDSWKHQIMLLGRTDQTLSRMMQSENDIFCVSGEGHPCAEDCGGAEGWELLKQAFRKQGGDKEFKKWYKNTCVNGDRKGLNPYQWSICDVNEQLDKVHK